MRAYPPNTQFRFDHYQVEDSGISMAFIAANFSDVITIFLSDAELASVSTQPQLATLVTNKLQRKVRATGVASKLDQFIGQSITV